MNSAGRALFCVACVLALSACGGGGGNSGDGSGSGGNDGNGSGGNNNPQQPYSITASESSISLQKFTSRFSHGIPPSQRITLSFTGPTIDIGDVPDWLTVSGFTQAPRTSPATIEIRSTVDVGVGDYSTTLHFTTSDADGSNSVSADVTVSLQVQQGTEVDLSVNGLATGNAAIARIDDRANVTVRSSDQLWPSIIVGEGATFTVSMVQQPQNQRCIFENGETTRTATGLPVALPYTLVELYCNATLMPWTWMGGSQTSGAEPVYGTRGTPSSGNTPGAREAGAYAADAHGNLYLFGGSGKASEVRNDLWRYDIDAGTWTWLSGSNAANGSPGVYGTLTVPDSNNVPGARTGAVAWTDANGDFWLFGGVGYASDGEGYLNDVWKYDVDAGVWTWMGGGSHGSFFNLGTYGTTPSINNIPGGRKHASVAQNRHGDVWIFGGYGNGSIASQGRLNDLWRFTPTTGEWSWMSGSDRPVTDPAYGTQGVADAANYPDGREHAALWADANGNIWIFGGALEPGERGDMWRYDPGTDMWTWMNGSDQPNRAQGQYSVPGTSTSDVPAARAGAASWTDLAGNLWMFGGVWDNDLWKYTPATNTWSWLSGGHFNTSPSVFGTQGVASDTNIPSDRSLPASWRDSSGRLWLYGGHRYNDEQQSDLWRFDPQ